MLYKQLLFSLFFLSILSTPAHSHGNHHEHRLQSEQQMRDFYISLADDNIIPAMNDLLLQDRNTDMTHKLTMIRQLGAVKQARMEEAFAWIYDHASQIAEVTPFPPAPPVKKEKNTAPKSVDVKQPAEGKPERRKMTLPDNYHWMGKIRRERIRVIRETVVNAVESSGIVMMQKRIAEFKAKKPATSS